MGDADIPPAHQESGSRFRRHRQAMATWTLVDVLAGGGYVYAAFAGFAAYYSVTRAVLLFGGLATRYPSDRVYSWIAIFLWSAAAVFFAFAALKLVLRRARLGLVYTVAVLHGIGVLARGLRPIDMAMWIFISGAAIGFFRQSRPGARVS